MVRRVLVVGLLAVVALLVGASWSSRAEAYPCSASVAAYEYGVPFGAYEHGLAVQSGCPAHSALSTVVSVEQWDGSVWRVVAPPDGGPFDSFNVAAVAYNYWGCCGHYRARGSFSITISGVEHDYGLLSPTFDTAAWSVL